MNIGLIDVDGHHKKKKFGATVYPNLALGKIARWHLMKGDPEVVGVLNHLHSVPYEVLLACHFYIIEPIEKRMKRGGGFVNVALETEPQVGD